MTNTTKEEKRVTLADLNNGRLNHQASRSSEWILVWDQWPKPNYKTLQNKKGQKEFMSAMHARN